MEVCRFCKESTPVEYSFCVHCENQTKCLNCGKKTFPGKDFCLACTKPLYARPVANQAPNQYERKVKKDGDNYEERVSFALSDESVKAIAPFIINQVMPDAVGVALPPSSESNANTMDTNYEDVTNTSNSSEETNADQVTTQSDSPNTHVPSSGSSNLNRFFRKDGSFLLPTNRDFKGQSWGDQQRNFILLYLKAHKEILGKPVPDREHVKAVANKIGVADKGNFSNYLNRTIKAHALQLTEGFELNDDGEKEVVRILSLMDSQSAKAGNAYWSRPASPQVQKSRLSGDDKKRVETWVIEPVELGQLDIRDIKIARDYALLGFWIITFHLKKAKAIKWNEVIHYLTKKFETVKVEGHSFSKSISKNEKFFTKTSEGAYYLTPDGQRIVEGWISGKAPLKVSQEK